MNYVMVYYSRLPFGNHVNKHMHIVSDTNLKHYNKLIFRIIFMD